MLLNLKVYLMVGGISSVTIKCRNSLFGMRVLIISDFEVWPYLKKKSSSK